MCATGGACGIGSAGSTGGSARPGRRSRGRYRSVRPGRHSQGNRQVISRQRMNRCNAIEGRYCCSACAHRVRNGATFAPLRIICANSGWAPHHPRSSRRPAPAQRHRLCRWTHDVRFVGRDIGLGTGLDNSSLVGDHVNDLPAEQDWVRVGHSRRPTLAGDPGPARRHRGLSPRRDADRPCAGRGAHRACSGGKLYVRSVSACVPRYSRLHMDRGSGVVLPALPELDVHAASAAEPPRCRPGHRSRSVRPLA